MKKVEMATELDFYRECVFCSHDAAIVIKVEGKEPFNFCTGCAVELINQLTWAVPRVMETEDGWEKEYQESQLEGKEEVKEDVKG